MAENKTYEYPNFVLAGCFRICARALHISSRSQSSAMQFTSSRYKTIDKIAEQIANYETNISEHFSQNGSLSKLEILGVSNSQSEAYRVVKSLLLHGYEETLAKYELISLPVSDLPRTVFHNGPRNTSPRRGRHK